MCPGRLRAAGFDYVRTWAAEHADAFAHLTTDETGVGTPVERSGLELDPAARRMIEATNAKDTPGFLATFAEDAIVDDCGRRFSGRAQIAAWNDRENIGPHNRIAVTDVRPTADGVTLTIQVSGDGYHGCGTFTISSDGDTISSLVIRG